MKTPFHTCQYMSEQQTVSDAVVKTKPKWLCGKPVLRSHPLPLGHGFHRQGSPQVRLYTQLVTSCAPFSIRRVIDFVACIVHEIYNDVQLTRTLLSRGAFCTVTSALITSCLTGKATGF